MKRYIKSATSNARYTIKSVSDEGTYFLVKDWRKNKELWVNKEKMDRHPEWWFTSSGKAKQSLKSLLSVMDEYLTDTFTVIDDSGNETPLDVKDLGFDHIPDYWDDDIDACDKITASTSASSIVDKIYSVMMDYEYGYDPDMTDINTMLQELTSKGVHVDTSDAFKKAWISAHNKAERKTWGSSGDSYHYDSLTPGELEAIENYDTEYWEYVKDHPFNLKPASITSSTDTKYFANMVSASSFDSAYDENDNLYQFHVAGYLGDDYRGLMEDWYTNDFEEALEHAFGMGSQGLFVEIENQVDGRSRKLTPEEWEDAAEWGEYPDHIREDLAL